MNDERELDSIEAEIYAPLDEEHLEFIKQTYVDRVWAQRICLGFATEADASLFDAKVIQLNPVAGVGPSVPYTGLRNRGQKTVRDMARAQSLVQQVSQNSKERRKDITTIVLHTTDGTTLDGALSTLAARGLSYHYLIDVDGDVVKAVDFERVAYHAGQSYGPDGANVNSYSIGISMVNDGVMPFTKEQIASTANLIRELAAKIPTLKWITTHSRISPGRKRDPEKNFPYKQFISNLPLTNWEPPGFKE